MIFEMQAAGIELLFYGDSLTELWRGTVWGYNSRLGPGIPAVFSRYFGQYRSVVAGAGGTLSNSSVTSYTVLLGALLACKAMKVLHLTSDSQAASV